MDEACLRPQVVSVELIYPHSILSETVAEFYSHSFPLPRFIEYIHVLITRGPKSKSLFRGLNRARMMEGMTVTPKLLRVMSYSTSPQVNTISLYAPPVGNAPAAEIRQYPFTFASVKSASRSAGESIDSITNDARGV